MTDQEEMLVQVAGWKSFPWLRHGFSTRFGGVSTVYIPPNSNAGTGDLNLGWTKDDHPALIAENRRRLIAAVSGSPSGGVPLVTVRQVHSNLSLAVPEPTAAGYDGFVTDDGRPKLEADGMMTGATGILLGIQTADCVPVFVVDTRLRAVANFHAGWRGTAARIVELGIARMTAEFNSRTEDLIAAIGPSIGSCCYSVGDEVQQVFSRQFAYGESLFSRPGLGLGLHLDLSEANRRQLLDAGLGAEHIDVVAECTGCAGLPNRRRYFSHRCEHWFTGRMLNVIGIV